MSRDREIEIGKRLLESSEVVGMDEVLSQIRRLHALRHPKSTFNIPIVDTLLNNKDNPQFLADGQDQDVDKTSQLLQYLTNNQTSSSRATLIELTSRQPEAGKYILLTHLVSTILLPKKFQDHDMQGKESIVVLIDGHDKFDLVLLWDMMHNALVASNLENATTNESITSTVEEAFGRLYLLRPKSLHSLLETLENLANNLLTAKHLSCFPVGLIAVNAASDYYVAHRVQQISISEPNALIDALFALASPSQPMDSPDPTQPDEDVDINTQQETKHINFNSMIQHLRSLSQGFNCPVVCTTLIPDVFSSDPRIGTRTKRRERDGSLQPQRQPVVAPSDRAPTLNPAFPVLPTIQMAVSSSSLFSGDFEIRDLADESMNTRGYRFHVTLSDRNTAETQYFDFVYEAQGDVKIIEAHDSMT